jgi:hypothetical protein
VGSAIAPEVSVLFRTEAMGFSGRRAARLVTATFVAGVIALACGGTSSLDFPGAPGVDAGDGSTPICLLAGEIACGALCVPVHSDPRNCGGCGVACGEQAPLCNAGACSSACNAQLTECKLGCVDLATDVHDCGACGATCAESQTCAGGHCACPSGTVACAGACIDVMVDAANCGSCGVVCKGTTPFCDRGVCAATCAPGLTPCSHACINTLASARNCGGCNLKCATGLACKGGRCAP